MIQLVRSRAYTKWISDWPSEWVRSWSTAKIVRSAKVIVQAKQLILLQSANHRCVKGRVDTLWQKAQHSSWNGLFSAVDEFVDLNPQSEGKSTPPAIRGRRFERRVKVTKSAADS